MKQKKLDKATDEGQKQKAEKWFQNRRRRVR
jgi:hypothetical protein